MRIITKLVGLIFWKRRELNNRVVLSQIRVVQTQNGHNRWRLIHHMMSRDSLGRGVVIGERGVVCDSASCKGRRCRWDNLCRLQWLGRDVPNAWHRYGFLHGNGWRELRACGCGLIWLRRFLSAPGPLSCSSIITELEGEKQTLCSDL